MKNRPPKDLYVTDVSVIIDTSLTQVILCGGLVDQTPRGPQRSARELRLGMTPVEASRLLVILQGMAAAGQLPELVAQAELTAVPPAKDRN